MAKRISFTPELGAKICDELETGRSLRAICRDEGMPSEGAVRTWASSIPDFQAQYTRARELGYQAMADEIIEISDESSRDTITKTNADGSKYEAPDQEHMARSRLRVDTRKWLLSKCLPKIYGDKTSVELNAAVAITDLTDADRAAKLAQLLLTVSKRAKADDGSDLV